jgi:hypothetical protein
MFLTDRLQADSVVLNCGICAGGSVFNSGRRWARLIPSGGDSLRKFQRLLRLPCGGVPARPPLNSPDSVRLYEPPGRSSIETVGRCESIAALTHGGACQTPASLWRRGAACFHASSECVCG